MRYKQFGLFFVGILALVIVMSAVSAVTLAEWPLTSSAVPINVSSSLTATSLVAGTGISGLTFNATNGATGTGWNQGALGALDYYQVTLTVLSGFNLNINSISFNQLSSDSTTNMSFDVNWSKDNFVTSTNIVSGGISTTASALSSTNTNIPLTGGETLTLRIFGYNSDSSSTETFSIKNLSLQGTVTAVTPSTTVPPEVTTCSTIGNPGQLDVNKINFQNNGMQFNTFGKDDEWFPLEEIEVEIEVENNGNDDVDDVSLEWGLWDTQAGDWVIDLDEEDEVNIKDSDQETLTITFTIDNDLDVDLEDLNDGNHYRLYVVATGTVDNVTSPETCVSDFETASIIIESDFVVIDNVEIPEIVQCGETVQVSADVWNIGDSDQDSVSLEILGRENILGISETSEVGDLNAFDRQPVSFTFEVPRNLEDGKFYALALQVKDEDGDTYQNDFDDDDSEFIVPFKVEGNCGAASGAGKLSVDASLVSGGMAGEDLVVKATITNNDVSTKTYKIGAAGFTEWADSASVDQSTIVLNAGQSKDVVFTFEVSEDASDENSFFIEATSGSEVVRQPVSVNIEPRSGLRLDIFSGNWTLWAIGLLNIILVIVIIIVAVRIAKKK